MVPLHIPVPLASSPVGVCMCVWSSQLHRGVCQWLECSQGSIQGHWLCGENPRHTTHTQKHTHTQSTISPVNIFLSHTHWPLLAKQAISHWTVIGWAELNRGRQRGHDTQQIRLNGAFKPGQRRGNPIENTHTHINASACTCTYLQHFAQAYIDKQVA